VYLTKTEGTDYPESRFNWVISSNATKASIEILLPCIRKIVSCSRECITSQARPVEEHDIHRGGEHDAVRGRAVQTLKSRLQRWVRSVEGGHRSWYRLEGIDREMICRRRSGFENTSLFRDEARSIWTVS
jgi:hypothetical protein